MKKVIIVLGIVAAVVVAFVIGIAVGAGKSQTDTDAQKNLSPEVQKRAAQFAPDAQLSPFTAVRFDGDKAIVTYDGAEYELAAIDGVQISDLLKFCREKYNDNWQKRFAEDLVVVFSDMGHSINADHTVSLTLIDPKTGEKKNIDHAPMTEENRQKIHEAYLPK